MIRVNTAERLKIPFKSPIGSFATGLVATDFSSSRVQIAKGDGSISFISLVLNTNLFEVDSTNSPGLYEILLSTSNTDTLGQFSLTAIPTATAFVEVSYIDSVETAPSSSTDLSTAITTINAHTDTKFGEIEGGSWNAMLDNLHQASVNLATVQSTLTASVTAIEGSGFSTLTDSLKVISDNIDIANAAITSAVTSIKGPQNISISSIAGGASFSPTADTLHAVSQAVGTIPTETDSIWDEVRSIHTTSGTFGEAIRILVQVARGHIKIDKFSNSLKVFQENGTDILFECPLTRNSVPASVFSDERLQAL